MKYFTVAGMLLLSCQIASADNFDSYIVLKNEGGAVIAVRDSRAGDPITCLNGFTSFINKIKNGIVWSSADYMILSVDSIPRLAEIKNFLVGLRCEAIGGSTPTNNEVKKN